MQLAKMKIKLDGLSHITAQLIQTKFKYRNHHAWDQHENTTDADIAT